MSSTLAPSAEKSLKDAALKAELQRLRQTDNRTNWYFLVRTYLFLAVVIGGAVWFDQVRQEHSWCLLWSVAVFVPAIIVIGACQHQLSGLAHEGTHHILFKNRTLNEFVSDWFCLFPLFSSTHHYRLQHLAHHQFVNDPQRDPDISQLQTSGHWLSFPVSARQFLRSLVKQLWLPNLARFILVRAQYNATGTDKNPYLRKGAKQSKLAVRIGLLYLVSLFATLVACVYYEQPTLLAVIPAVLWLAVMTAFAALPGSKFHQSRLHPVISQKTMSMLRVSYLTLVFAALAWVQVLTGVWAWAYYGLLWLVPIFTSFSFFMIMRQWVQHGNGDRGWLTNTRVFYVDQFINFAVFPMGMEYHLPHHMFATVPHYRLKELHAVLLQYPEYRKEAIEVHGYFRSPEHPQVHPTVVDVLGPDYAAQEFRGVYIDNTVLDDCEVEEKEQIVAEGETEKERIARANG
ncbi:MAG: fatty acid desaturase [Gemmataceae bacterium]